jgi:photosystem II stability/assembly factor-like uncharacterized protein
VKRWLIKQLLLSAIALSALSSAQAYEVLELPAVNSPLAQTSLMYSITTAGDRLVATGIRGHILLSDDDGKTWRQSQSVPVRSDLLGVTFISEQEGWAVGHDSVILYTADGGETWIKQFDGRKLGETGTIYYQQKLVQAQTAFTECNSLEQDNERCKRLESQIENFDILVGEMEFAAQQGADKPFFSIFCFRDSCNATGAYGINYKTKDKGITWLPVLENVDNPDFGHLYSIAVVNDKYAFIGGEMGSTWLVDIADSDWKYIKLNYEGSLFSVAVATDESLLAGGLGGNLFRSTDMGETWVLVEKPRTGSLLDAGTLADGSIVFLSQDGQLIISKDNGATFSRLEVSNRYQFVSFVQASSGDLVVVGTNGPSIVKLKK